MVLQIHKKKKKKGRSVTRNKGKCTYLQRGKKENGQIQFAFMVGRVDEDKGAMVGGTDEAKRRG